MKYIVIFISVFSFAFTSCMHTMMMGGHGDHEGHAATKVTKEVTKNGATLSVTVDPMIVGTESVIAVSISSTISAPDSLNVHYMISKNSGAAESSAHNHGSSSTSNSEFATIHGDAAIKNGKLNIPFTPTVTGEFTLSVHTDAVSTEVQFSVGEEQSSGMGGMMGISSEYWYLGAIAMAGMMIVMWTVRGGIF
ncbi:MAG: hypothetical protein HYV29_12765 [Ignavibacteriales bacterium]|nr:hypothetical protein [Ignavibacteriales bacterium]